MFNNVYSWHMLLCERKSTNFEYPKLTCLISNILLATYNESSLWLEFKITIQLCKFVTLYFPNNQFCSSWEEIIGQANVCFLFRGTSVLLHTFFLTDHPLFALQYFPYNNNLNMEGIQIFTIINDHFNTTMGRLTTICNLVIVTWHKRGKYGKCRHHIRPMYNLTLDIVRSKYICKILYRYLLLLIVHNKIRFGADLIKYKELTLFLVIHQMDLQWQQLVKHGVYQE